MSRLDRLTIFLATGFYAGRIPAAPGTFGTGVGLFFCYLLSRVNGAAALAACLALVVAFSIVIAGKAEKLLGGKDPGEIVIDEIAGIMITLAAIPFTAASAAAGFLLFRVLDIIKPFPIRYIDSKMSGGTGIVMDDVIAGVIAHIVMRFLFGTAA